MQYFLKLITILILFALVGCAGTGTKNLASVATQIDTTGDPKVFVIRDDSYVGSAVMMRVQLNNIDIGELGAGEMIFCLDSNI